MSTTFKPLLNWNSDQVKEFKNEASTRLANTYRTNHTVTTAYSPQFNSSVDVVCRKVLQDVHARLTKMMLGPVSWPKPLPMVHSMLNHSPSPQLKKTSSGAGILMVTAFAQLQANNLVLSSFLRKDLTKSHSLELVKVRQLLLYARIVSAIDRNRPISRRQFGPCRLV